MSSFILLQGKSHDLGEGMIVSRVLPQAQKRMVGPFTFFDHMGPVEAQAGQNTDVRPHPHIGLSTLTYLFEGRIVHRDSIGSVASILPGEVNWMTAGRGISHSERTHEEDKGKARKMHGLQFWIALPDDQEDVAPSFQHYEKSQIPRTKTAEYEMTLVAGEAFGLKSPVKTSSPLFLAHVVAQGEGRLPVNLPDFEVGIYLIKGDLEVAGQKLLPQQMILFPASEMISEIEFSAGAEFIVLGGEAFASPRHMYWNLVSSSKEKIENAKQLWKSGKFPMVPGETEFIPWPD